MLNLVGKTLGDYRLDEIIGEGGMATVYKAYQLSLKRFVAVKVLYYQEDTSLVRFEREAKAIAALRHRNILIIYEYGEYEGMPFIAMEYVAGGTLEDRLNGKPMEWRRVVELTIPVAEALHYAHSQGIIHRDVKPSNILMPQDDWPVLADFGLVKRSDDENALTLSGMFMGTPSYIAPEQARALQVDYRADMYALGVIMFEMVTGRLPFAYENPNKILLAHVMDPPPRPTELNPDCPPALEAIILRMMEKKPEDRFANLQETVAALRELQDQPAVSEPPPPEPMKEEPLTPEPAEIEEEAQSPVGRFFSRLFGGSQKKKDTASKTAPREQLDIEEEDDFFDQTIQLNLGDSDQPTPCLVVQGRDAVIQLPNQSVIIIGRTYGSSHADVDLEPYQASKYGVSRRHARLKQLGDNWQIEDLNSLNGTFVNDKKLKPGQPTILADGDRIRLSQMTLIFVLS